MSAIPYKYDFTLFNGNGVRAGRVKFDLMNL